MKKTSGMTLIEMVIAIGLFGIIAVAIFPSLIILAKMNLVSDANLSSNYIAQDVSETLFNYSETISESELINSLVTVQSFSLVDSNETTYNLYKENEDYKNALIIILSDSTYNFIRATVTVSTLNPSLSNQYSQIESILSFGD